MATQEKIYLNAMDFFTSYSVIDTQVGMILVWINANDLISDQLFSSVESLQDFIREQLKRVYFERQTKVELPVSIVLKKYDRRM